MLHRLCCCGVERAKGHIISSRLRGLHREMTAVVTGHPNLGVTPQQFTRLPNVAIALPQMHAICLQALGQSNTVIHDESHVMRGANGLQWLRERCSLMLI